MPSVTIRVADAMRVSGFIDNETVAKSSKDRLSQFIAASASTLLDRAMPPMESINVSIWLSAPQCEALLNWGGTLGLSVGEAASSMLIFSFQEWTSQQVKVEPQSRDPYAAGNRLATRLTQCGLAPREEQLALYRTFDALDEADDRRVLVAESGTGTGKTIAYLSYALDCLEDNPLSRVYVALPTFALMSQVRVELTRLNGQKPLRILFLMGQSEWVSEIALRDLLDQAAQGEIPIPHELQSRLHALMAQWGRGTSFSNKSRPWSMADLELAVPEFAWRSDVSLNSGQAETDLDDAGRRAYSQQFADMNDGRLIVLTHAMLAHLLKRRFIASLKASKGDDAIKLAMARWKETPPALREGNLFSEINALVCDIAGEDVKVSLPDADLLIIDEAHTFKAAVTRAFETHESMFALVQQARQLCTEFPDVFHRDSSHTLSEMLQTMKNMGIDSDVLEIENSSAMLSQLSEAVQQALDTKKTAPKRAKAQALNSRHARKLAAFARAVATFATSVHESPYFRALLHWSPKRDYPRLSFGARDVKRECNFLWTNFAQRSLLVSGTLYEENPLPSCETARQQLAIPHELLRTMTPIHAKWQIDPVTLFMVAQMQDLDGRQRFCRPLSKGQTNPNQYNQDLALWLDDVFNYVQRVRKTSVGGVLVVGTAFADIHTIADRISNADSTATLFVHRAGVSLSALREQFLAASAQGLKPTLLGVGGVWTGFDLHDPENPDALTDLVILNIPFGQQGQSISALLDRLADQSHFALASHALMLVRQVLGRLVRSPNTPANRRIHFLDARMHRSEWRGITSPIRRFLARYKQVSVG